MATKYAKQTFVTVPNRNTLQTVGAHAQAVYLWLCAMQDSAGRSFPSNAKLRELTGLGRCTVIKATQDLEAVGLIVKTTRMNGGAQTSNLYEIMIIDVEPVLEPQELPAPSIKKTPSARKTTPSVTQTPPVHQVDAPRTADRHRTKSKELKPTTKTKELKPAAPAKAEDVVGSLYFQVIKQLQLPMRNATNVKSSIAKLKREISEADAIQYLTFMRDKYAGMHWDYKPSVNDALDIYAKRVQIINSIKQAQVERQKTRGIVI